MEDPDMEYARVAYTAYGDAAAWKTYDGRAMPSWPELSATELGQETQRRWAVAIRETIDYYNAQIDPPGSDR